MSVVAAAAAVGPAPVAAPTAVTYGLCGGGGGDGVRKRKEVVRREEEVAEEEYGRGGDDGPGAGGGHVLFVLGTVEEERGAEGERERELSSIGAASDGEEEEEGEEAESRPETWRRKKKGGAGGLTCLDALDDALPIKRGLSSFFSGKSRSFANLQDVAGTTSGAKDVLAKPENPFNKRRRILRCCSIRRVSSTSLTALPPFLPPGPEPSFNDAVINGGGGGGSG